MQGPLFRGLPLLLLLFASVVAYYGWPRRGRYRGPPDRYGGGQWGRRDRYRERYRPRERFRHRGRSRYGGGNRGSGSNCPEGQVYMTCGSACPRTCANPSPVCANTCVEGCQCPRWMLEHNGICYRQGGCPAGATTPTTPITTTRRYVRRKTTTKIKSNRQLGAGVGEGLGAGVVNFMNKKIPKLTVSVPAVPSIRSTTTVMQPILTSDITNNNQTTPSAVATSDNTMTTQSQSTVVTETGAGARTGGTGDSTTSTPSVDMSAFLKLLNTIRNVSSENNVNVTEASTVTETTEATTVASRPTSTQLPTSTSTESTTTTNDVLLEVNTTQPINTDAMSLLNSFMPTGNTIVPAEHITNLIGQAQNVSPITNSPNNPPSVVEAPYTGLGAGVGPSPEKPRQTMMTATQVTASIAPLQQPVTQQQQKLVCHKWMISTPSSCKRPRYQRCNNDSECDRTKLCCSDSTGCYRLCTVACNPQFHPTKCVIGY